MGCWGRSACIRSPSLVGGGQILSDIPPLTRAGGVSPFLPDQLVYSLGAVGRDLDGAFSSFAWGTTVGRSRPAL